MITIYKLRFIIAAVIIIALGWFGYSYYKLTKEVSQLAPIVAQDNGFLQSLAAVNTQTGLNGFSMYVYQADLDINKVLAAQQTSTAQQVLNAKQPAK